MLNKKNNITNTIINLVDWEPTYWIMGGCLAYTAYKLGFIQTISAKLWNKEAGSLKPEAKKTATTN